MVMASMDETWETVKWVNVKNTVGPVQDDDSYSVMVHYDAIPIPYNIQLLWHADPMKDQRIFILSLWYENKRYKFQHTVKEDWYAHVNPAAISHSLLLAFIKVTSHQFNWHKVARERLASWWVDNSGSVVGYHGKMTHKDIEWLMKDTDPLNLGEDLNPGGGHEWHWHESDLTPVKPTQTATLDPSMASMALPGMNTRVQFPCGCEEKYKFVTPQLYDLVQHLNDVHKWTREKIADWLDELHDSGKVNLEFSPWGQLDEEEETSEEKVELRLDPFLDF